MQFDAARAAQQGRGFLNTTSAAEADYNTTVCVSLLMTDYSDTVDQRVTKTGGTLQKRTLLRW